MYGIRVSINGIIFMLHFVKIVQLFMLHFEKIVQLFMLYFVKTVQLFEKLKWRNGHTDDVVISNAYFSLFRKNSA
jgi:hypothetical protein